MEPATEGRGYIGGVGQPRDKVVGQPPILGQSPKKLVGTIKRLSRGLSQRLSQQKCSNSKDYKDLWDNGTIYFYRGIKVRNYSI